MKNNPDNEAQKEFKEKIEITEKLRLENKELSRQLERVNDKLKGSEKFKSNFLANMMNEITINTERDKGSSFTIIVPEAKPDDDTFFSEGDEIIFFLILVKEILRQQKRYWKETGFRLLVPVQVVQLAGRSFIIQKQVL